MDDYENDISDSDEYSDDYSDEEDNINSITWQFIRACEYNDILNAILLIEQYDLYSDDNLDGIDIHAKNELAFRLACLSGSKETLEFLLQDNNNKFNINVNAKDDEYEDTGFILACTNGHLNIIEYLLSNDNFKVDINIMNDRMYTGFMLACMNNRLDIVKYLLSNNNININIHIDNFDIYIGFKLACQNNHFHMVKYMLQENNTTFNINIDANNSYVFMLVCEYGHFEIAKLLSEYNSNYVLEIDNSKNIISNYYVKENIYENLDKNNIIYVDEDNEISCSICLDNNITDEHIMIGLNCNYTHTFHINCITKNRKVESFNNITNKCPLCRQEYEIEKSAIYKLK